MCSAGKSWTAKEMKSLDLQHTRWKEENGRRLFRGEENLVEVLEVRPTLRH